MSDGQKRIRLLRAIEAGGFEVRKMGFREEAKYTRILTVPHKFRLTEEGEPDLSDDAVRQAVANLWKKLWRDGANIVDVLKEFDWS